MPRFIMLCDPAKNPAKTMKCVCLTVTAFVLVCDPQLPMCCLGPLGKSRNRSRNRHGNRTKSRQGHPGRHRQPAARRRRVGQPGAGLADPPPEGRVRRVEMKFGAGAVARRGILSIEQETSCDGNVGSLLWIEPGVAPGKVEGPIVPPMLSRQSTSYLPVGCLETLTPGSTDVVPEP
jgi:hypothetical protein